MFVGTGLIVQLIYSTAGGAMDQFGLLTEDSNNILTENNQDIDTEH